MMTRTMTRILILSATGCFMEIPSHAKVPRISHPMGYPAPSFVPCLLIGMGFRPFLPIPYTIPIPFGMGYPISFRPVSVAQHLAFRMVMVELEYWMSFFPAW